MGQWFCLDHQCSAVSLQPASKAPSPRAQLGTEVRFCSEESDQDGVESKSMSTLRVTGINPEWDRSLPAMSLTQEPTAAIPHKSQTGTLAKLHKELNFSSGLRAVSTLHQRRWEFYFGQ